MKVKDDSEAIKYMNDSEFGLTASIWTKDTDKGYELAEEVEAGTVFVNRCDYPAPVRSFFPFAPNTKGFCLV
jgi:acyl-CoA reductase-like NAD-dependent aldehyde dehydrogenase